MKRIAVAEGAVPDLAWISSLSSELNFEMVSGPVETIEDLRETAKNCDALIVSLAKLGAEKIAALPTSVKCIGRLGVGVDNIDVSEAAKCQISVIYQPLYGINEVANHAMAMIMALHRGLFSADHMVRTNQWGVATDVAELISLQDSTVGVIGCGRIGQAVINRMQPFVKKVLGFDVAMLGEIAGVEMVSSLEELLSSSQIVSLHTPHMPATHHIIDAPQLAIMPKGAILVNVSRGGLINEPALAQALESNQISAAGLDVFEIEPLPMDSVLRKTKNLIMSPHIAWYSKSSGPRVAQWTIRDVVSCLDSNQIRHGSFACGPFTED
jgi:D-3-phosphoglycerate dehydrogenase